MTPPPLRRDRILLLLLAVGSLYHLSGLLWGVPGPDSWANDSIAARDHLAGVYLSLAPGKYFRYPLFHLLVLGVISLPSVLAALPHTAPALGAPGFRAAFVAEIVREPYTSWAIVSGRLVTVAMSAVAMWAFYAIGARLFGRRAGLLGLLFLLGNAWFNYYSHTTNLDLPQLMWVLLCLDRLLAARADGRRRDRTLAAIFAALAVATKDQAGMALALPILAVVAADTLRASERGEQVRLWLRSSAIGAIVYGFASGALLNPSGYLARLRWLLGPASQNWTEYAPTLDGRTHLLADAGQRIATHGYTPVCGLLGAAAVVLAVATVIGQRRGWLRLLPVAAAVSMTLLFNLTALRASVRFLLLHSVVVAWYVGWLLDVLLGRAERRDSPARGPARIASLALVAVMAAGGLGHAARVNASLYTDPRLAAERWLAGNAPAGTTVEVYAKNYNLVRLPPRLTATRVRSTPLAHRNPISGLTEVRAEPADIATRRPDLVVLHDAYFRRYLSKPASGHRTRNEVVRRSSADSPTRAHFAGLLDGSRGYREVFRSTPRTGGLLPAFPIHNSTTPTVRILARAGWQPRQVEAATLPNAPVH